MLFALCNEFEQIVLSFAFCMIIIESLYVYEVYTLVLLAAGPGRNTTARDLGLGWHTCLSTRELLGRVDDGTLLRRRRQHRTRFRLRGLRRA